MKITHKIMECKYKSSYRVITYVMMDLKGIQPCPYPLGIGDTRLYTKNAAEKFVRIASVYVDDIRDPNSDESISDVFQAEIAPKLEVIKENIRMKEENIQAKLALIVLGK